MTIGERIRKRREELGLTQDDLAVRLGYRSRSSINKIENDASGLPQSKIEAIAKALDTTPAYIMGWEDTHIDRLMAYAKMLSARDLSMLEDIAKAMVKGGDEK